MKVYFIGSHSTGKTTLARHVATKYGLPLLNEVARAVQAEGEIPIARIRADLAAADQFQTQVFERQMREESGKDSFVSDRSFDNLAYAARHSTVFRKLLASKEFTAYVESLRDKNVMLFFVRPARALMTNDGIRESVDWDEMLRIDGSIEIMLEMWGMRHFSIWSPNLRERMRLVDSVLSFVAAPLE